jgi:hypothetical protein
MEKEVRDKITLQMFDERCKWCWLTLNFMGDRGQGKKRQHCNPSCQRQNYLLRKRITNLEQEYELLNPEEKYTPIYQFIKHAKNYLEAGLPAVYIKQHLDCILESQSVPALEILLSSISKVEERT